MISLAEIQLGAPGWSLFVPVAIITGLGLLVYAYRSLTVQRALSGGAAGLKLLAIAILAITLTEPLWSGTRMVPGTNLFAVLVDDSQSLAIQDPKTGKPRSEQLKQLLASANKQQPEAQARWLIDLEQNFSVRKYSLDSHAHARSDLTHLKFEGTSSNLVTSINELNQRYQKLPLAGILVLTDGISASDTSQLKSSVPIYPVPIGHVARSTDLAITNTSVSYSPFEDAPIRILADLSATECQQKQLTAQLIDPAGKVVETITREVSQPQQQFQLRFQVKSEETGVAFYRIKTSVNIPEGGELTLANNKGTLKVDRGRKAHRVLYVSGRPNWEFKFLRRAIHED
ncbi:MAG: hypothetical protein ACF8CY_02825, partial [Gimesia chilikensis]